MRKYKLTSLCVFVLFFIASCGGGGSSPSVVYLPPIYTIDYSDISFLEGTLPVVTLNAVDSNNRSVVHSIVGGDDEKLFTMKANGALSFLTTPDYEKPHDSNGDNKYDLIVEAMAGINTTTQNITITTQDAFEGRVVDGPLVGALVFVDNNDNYILDADEKYTTTNSEGFFYLDKNSLACSDACDKKILSQAGFDAQIGLKSNLFLMASVDIDAIVQVTPLSTLIEASTDADTLIKTFNLTNSKNEILTTNVWSLAKEGNQNAREIMRVNFQIGLVLSAAQDLLSAQPGIAIIQFRSLASKRLSSIVNTRQKALYNKDALNEYFTNIVAEIGPDLNFDNVFIESLAKSVANVNALLEEKSLNPVDNITPELLLFARTSIKNSIQQALEGNFDYSQFIAATSIEKMFSNSTLIRELTDADADSFPDVIDLNDDNDSVDDLDDIFPFDKTETVDTDADGIGNNADLDDDDDGVNDDNDAYPLNKNVHTAPVAVSGSFDLNLLPKSQNTLDDNLAGTGQDNRNLAYSLVSNGSKGVVSITNKITGAFIYQTFSGVTEPSNDSFSFKVNDGFIDSSVSTVVISLKSDPLYQYQWHLDNIGQLNFASTAGIASKDINADGVIIEGYTGKGVIVAVVDSGLEITHEDIKDNIVTNGSFNFLDNSSDPTSATSEGDHGTSIAGIIGASGWNNLGGRGVAPKVSLKGFNLLKSGTYGNAISSLGGASYSNDVDVFNLSYGYDATSSFLINSAIKAQYIDGVSNLRAGKGAIYVASAGNGFKSFGEAICADANSNNLSCNNTSMDPEHSLPYVILVGALNAGGSRASYSTAGSAIWVSAPGGETGYDINIVGAGYTSYAPAIMTTDQSSCDKGYVRSNLSAYGNEFENKGNHSLNSSCNYTSTFYGSSASAPVVSGAIAILLEVNPNLSWRDVKHILAVSAVQVDASIEGKIINGYIAEPAWTTNAAGYKFHNFYGFGGIDLAAAVVLAKDYTQESLGTFVTSNEQSSGTLNAPIPDNSNTGRSATLTDSNNLTIEAINVNICLSHGKPSDLSIALTSPQGTRSVLLPPFNGFSSVSTCFNMLSNAFYGENSNGDWVIKIVDKKLNNEGDLNNWKLTVFGR